MPSIPFSDIEALSEDQPSPLVIDFDGVDGFNANGLGRLVTLHTRLLASGGHLVLCNVGERAFEALEVTGLTELLDVRRDGDSPSMS
jgi:anti-anti-sigma factor